MSKPEFAKNNKTKITAESGKQELEIISEFDAPRELVFKAYTDQIFTDNGLDHEG